MKESTLSKDDKFELSPWTLRFEDATEQAYQKDYLQTTLLRTRIGIILGALFYTLFYLLDILFVPDVKGTLFIIRFGIVGPYILSLFFVSYAPFYQKHQQLFNSIGILAAGGGIVFMTLLRPEYTFSYYAGIMLVLIYSYNLMGLRFFWASGASGIVVLSYILGMQFLTEIPFERLISNYFFLIGSNILLMFGGYFIEVLRRKDFYQRIQLKHNQKKIEDINLDLENIVTHRTAALIDEVAERKIAQRTTQIALKEKEALLKEVYHRTKNNMNVIISLLNLQAQEQSTRPSPKVFSQLSDRIHSMSLVHEQLYGSSNLSTIQLGKYVESLATQRRYSLLRNPEMIKIKIESEHVEVGLEQAVPLGLALNEILTNAIKHGYEDNQEGQIDIKIFKNESGNPEIKIANDGNAFPNSIDIENPETLGLRLLHILIVEHFKAAWKLITTHV